MFGSSKNLGYATLSSLPPSLPSLSLFLIPSKISSWKLAIKAPTTEMATIIPKPNNRRDSHRGRAFPAVAAAAAAAAGGPSIWKVEASPWDLLPSYFLCCCCSQASSVLVPAPPKPEEREMETRRGGEGAARWEDDDDDDDAGACVEEDGNILSWSSRPPGGTRDETKMPVYYVVFAGQGE